MTIIGWLIGIAAAAVAGFVAYHITRTLFENKKEKDEYEYDDDYYRESIPISTIDDVSPFIPGMELSSDGEDALDTYLAAVENYYEKEGKSTKGRYRKIKSPTLRYILEHGDNRVSKYVGNGRISYHMDLGKIRQSIKEAKRRNELGEDFDDDIFSKDKKKKSPKMTKKKKDKKKKSKKIGNDLFGIAS